MRKLVVFYSWQSDRNRKVCKDLIRSALDMAARRLNEEVCPGADVRIDADTQGIVGTPPVTETILEKIDACDVFVPDVSFVAATEDGKLVPNANVMIEYGYALKSKSPTRISSRTSHPSCEQHDGSGIEERCCGGDCSLEVLGETAVAPEPGEETLDHPAAWMHGKADLAGLFAHDLDDDPGGVRHSFGGIGAISEGTFDERIQRAGRP